MMKRSLPPTKVRRSPIGCIKYTFNKDFSSMALDYRNPNDWGKSPLTDRALRLEQFKAENPEQWSAIIEADIQALSKPIFESEDYPPFTGTEFLATHSSIDDHPYSAAFGQFLGNGIDADIANILAFGSNRFDLISEDLDDPVRQLATRIYSRFEEMGYWDELPQEPINIDYNNIPY
ncbi:hypothetical protein [Nostoc sp. WHI]|uniref:hypothetical protein n=1 Tax=Nostoc sp. WHI TaxID=2650611 RepID=UPI001E4B4DCC|nr:hypothetical protein [Nostoc sp. WHI]